MVIRDQEHRETYLDALQLADRGDLAPLVNLFANIMMQDLNDAITFVREVRGPGIREIARAAAEATKLRLEHDEGDLEQLTERLVRIADDRLQEVAYELKQAFTEAGVPLQADVLQNSSENAGWWHAQIVGAAKQYRYHADLAQGRFRRWVQMRLRVTGANMPQWHVVVSFHHKESRTGPMAAVVFLTTSGAELEEGRSVILGSPNEFTYSGGFRAADQGFRDWLDKALTKVLEIWQSRV